MGGGSLHNQEVASTSVSQSQTNTWLQLTIPLDPSGTWEEVAQSQAYSYHAFVYAWLTRRTDITIHVDLGPLQGKRTLQQLSELDPDAVNTMQLEYTNTLVSPFKPKQMKRLQGPSIDCPLVYRHAHLLEL